MLTECGRYRGDAASAPGCALEVASVEVKSIGDARFVVVALTAHIRTLSQPRLLRLCSCPMRTAPTFISTSKNICSIVVDELTVGYMRGDIRDDEWIAMLDWGKVNAVGVTGCLTLNINVNVSSKQRQLAVESQGSKPLKRIALLTDSALARGSLTAYGWLVGSRVRYKAYRPTEGEAALAWLAEQVRFDLAQARAALADVSARSRQ
jgi:hypothetical protein